MKLTGAIFDLDGTLFDSMHMWKRLASDYVRSLGKEAEPGLDKKLAAMTFRQAIEYCMQHYLLEGSVQQHSEKATERVMDFYFKDVQKKPGVDEFLQSLDAQGVKMCVATATDKRLVEPALKRNGIYDYFTDIFTCAGVGANKQTAKIYDVSIEALGTNRDTTLVFEDAYHAVVTAKKAGYKVIGVYDVNEPLTDEVAKLCDCYVRCLADLTPQMIEAL